MKKKFTDRVHNANSETFKKEKRKGKVIDYFKANKNTPILLLTLIYAMIAFYHLGSFKAPKTYYIPKAAQESFYIDFGRQTKLDGIYCFTGMPYSYNSNINMSFRLYASSDGRKYGAPNLVEVKNGTIWDWQKSDIDLSARYLRVDMLSQGIMLEEMAFTGDGIRKTLHIDNIFTDGSTTNPSDIRKLFDEQKTVALAPTFYDGAYFDEIYHARTAYEQLHYIEPYEFTHPPLGKTIIGIGIELFGMNPFGWRVMGTLFGIAMLPFIYMLALKLFENRRIAFLAAFLMACDFMHFTQTRIATIDVYGVFFIIAMYYYMYKFFTGDFLKDKLKDTLITLGLCGLAFALGAASKWICIYAGAGLAVLFFSTVIRRYMEYRKEKYAKDETGDKNFLKRSTTIFSWCILFFIIIPLIVYYLSYIPFMKVPGHTSSISEVVEQQIKMYNYHKGVTGGLEYAAHWWQWPLNQVPKWYAYDSYFAQ